MGEVMSPVSPALGPEDQLCLLLARGQLTPEVQTRSLQFLATPLQWPLIMKRAYSHQVYPLLYRNLRDLSFPGVPEAVQSELKGLCLANALRNQMLAEESARLLSLLGEDGIPVVPLEGVALVQSLYGETAARVCLDIDILVPLGDVTQAINLAIRGSIVEPKGVGSAREAHSHAHANGMLPHGRGARAHGSRPWTTDLPADTDIMPCDALPSWGNFACSVPHHRISGGHGCQRFFPGIVAWRAARQCRKAGRHGNRQPKLDRRRSPLQCSNFGQRRVRTR